jgi:hypothetical protein
MARQKLPVDGPSGIRLRHHLDLLSADRGVGLSMKLADPVAVTRVEDKLQHSGARDHKGTNNPFPKRGNDYVLGVLELGPSIPLPRGQTSSESFRGRATPTRIGYCSSSLACRYPH